MTNYALQQNSTCNKYATALGVGLSEINKKGAIYLFIYFAPLLYYYFNPYSSIFIKNFIKNTYFYWEFLNILTIFLNLEVFYHKNVYFINILLIRKTYCYIILIQWKIDNGQLLILLF